MFRLTREVRFAINDAPDDDDDAQLAHKPTNSFGGYPSLSAFGYYFAARVTLAGELEPRSQYLVNIKEIDRLVREHMADVARVVRRERAGPADLVTTLYRLMHRHWGERFASLAVALTPTLILAAHRSESPAMRLSQRFEFSASHRLHNPALSDEENRRCYGKCNNPHGHGHNYEVQVTLKGEPDRNGLIVSVPAFERVVAETVIDRFDHKHLNTELSEFRDLIPSVENIARVIHRLLKPKFEAERATLASVTVWETPKTWCEYEE